MRPKFGLDITNQTSNENSNNSVEQQRLQHVLNCARMAGRAVTRVVWRCDDAKENKILDLSDCQLTQIPDAVFHLMRHTVLEQCNLSTNVLTKIPPKFAVKFSHITELNLSNNRISKLPDELSDLSKLLRLDISFNSFMSIPWAVFDLPKLITLLANNNSILEVEIDRLKLAPSLKEVDLSNNPLNASTHSELVAITKPKITIPERQVEEWENLHDYATSTSD